MKTKLEQAFNLFVGDDELRPALLNPFEINGRVYATNAYVVIRTDKSNIDFEFKNENTPPKCEEVIPVFDIEKTLNVNKLEFDALKTQDEYTYVTCKECNGAGEVEWEYKEWEKDFDCPVCNGQGDKRYKTGNKTFENSVVKLGEAYFRIDLFYKLLEVQEILGGKIKLLTTPIHNKASMFKIGKCEIGVMPYFVSNERDVTIAFKIAY